jgi:hypothetical protein
MINKTGKDADWFSKINIEAGKKGLYDFSSGMDKKAIYDPRKDPRVRRDKMRNRKNQQSDSRIKLENLSESELNYYYSILSDYGYWMSQAFVAESNKDAISLNHLRSIYDDLKLNELDEFFKTPGATEHISNLNMGDLDAYEIAKIKPGDMLKSINEFINEISNNNPNWENDPQIYDDNYGYMTDEHQARYNKQEEISDQLSQLDMPLPDKNKALGAASKGDFETAQNIIDEYTKNQNKQSPMESPAQPQKPQIRLRPPGM